MLLGLLGAHAVAGGFLLAAGRRAGRWAWVVGGLAPAVAAVWVATRAGAVLDRRPVSGSTTWVPELGLGIDLRLDAFAVLMVVLVCGIGTLVFAYAGSYFGRSANHGRAAGLLTLFAGAMLGVVLADNLLLLYVCWELTSITSYLLIGINDAESEARSSALHALLVTGMGGLVMLGGFVLIGMEADTYRISEILADPPLGGVTAVALVLVLVGAFTKSAQYPFHSWLPAAMIAPTPISAYLHSAAMVKAGIYLVARLAPAFAGVGIWRPLVLVVGLTSMVAGGLRALRAFDLKQLLAFGTVSQLGFLMVLFGIGQPEATAAGCALLLAHAFFKAALFMSVGVIDHETHGRDIRTIPILAAGWTPVRVLALASAASMAAVPPLAGFIAKESAYGALVNGTLNDRIVLGVIVVGSMLTTAYALRFCVALVRPDLLARSSTARPVSRHGPAPAFYLPAALLAGCSVVLGVAPFLWSGLVEHASEALGSPPGAHLELWHGFTLPLGLSVVTLCVGGLLFFGRRSVASVQTRLAPRLTGTEVYEGAVKGVLRMAGWVTSIAQSGSLPIYAAVILTTAAVAPALALVSGNWWPGWPDLVGRPAHIPIAALLVAGASAATLATRRFAAALFLGVVGYAMAIFFVVQGAPDLALTQFAVETLSIVVFLLVLRRLPDRFDRRRLAVGRVWRLAVAGGVGLFVTTMAIAATGARTEPSISRAMSEQALEKGYGKNVVNVILVDIRGLDTLGEITVLVVAAIGIVALARAGSGPRRSSNEAAPTGVPGS